MVINVKHIHLVILTKIKTTILLLELKKLLLVRIVLRLNIVLSLLKWRNVNILAA